jgi:hypothetical protein
LQRVAPGGGEPVELARLPADQTTYTDEDIRTAGTYVYLLTTLRASGSSVPSFHIVEISRECFPGDGETALLKLQMLKLVLHEDYEGVYCYASINGSRYERLPAEPNLLHPPMGSREYDLPLQLPHRGEFELRVPRAGRVQLDGECWGRRGAESLRIGRFAASHPAGEWDGRELITNLVAPEPRELASTSGLPADAEAGSTLRYRIFEAEESFPLFGGIFLLPPPVLTSPTIPAPNNLRAEPSECATGEIPPLLCLFLVHLAWDWSGNDFYGEEDIASWRIDVNFVTIAPDGSTSESPGPSRTVRAFSEGRLQRGGPFPTIPGDLCGVLLRYRVTAIARDGTTSLPSDPLEIPTRECATTATVRITLVSFRVLPSDRSGEVNDDQEICIGCADRSLELLRTIPIMVLPSDIPALTIESAEAFMSSHLEMLEVAGAPIYGLRSLFGCPTEICVGEGVYGPEVLGWSREPLILRNPSRLVIVGLLRETDMFGSDAPFCFIDYRLPPPGEEWDADDWARLNIYHVHVSDYGEAKCMLEFDIQGSP